MSQRVHRAAQKTAVVLPASSRDRFQPLLERSGFEVVEDGGRPAVALVDLTDLGGAQALAALGSEKEAGVAILGVVGNDHAEAARALGAGCDGFVAVGSLDREFDLRLEAVRKLGVDRASQARREKDLAVLLELTAHYASSLDVAELLHDVTRRLAEELFIDRCALVLIDEERGHGHIVAASDDRAVHNVRIDLARYPEIREALRTSAPVVVDHAPRHPLLGEVKEALARRGISALAAVPLTVGKKTLGVLLLRASEQARSFQPHEISFAWTVAHATAIALRNARMLEGLRGQAEKAEAQVAELARYEAFFQHVSDGIAILDATGSVASLNPAGQQILGMKADQARGVRFAGLATEGSSVPMQLMLRSASDGAVVRNTDLDLQSGGRPLTVSAGASKASSAALIVSFRDVTDARALERELRKTKEFLERLIDASVDAIVAADLKGEVILFNRAAERILGYPQAEAIGKLRVEALYPGGKTAAKNLMALIRSAEHGGAGRLTQTRVELLSRTGERVPALMTAALLFEGTRAVASVGIFSDLRERTRLEAKLSDAQERLEVAEKQAVILELAGTAAHELNQPLTSVLGWAELLKRKLKEDDPTWRPVDIIYREAERMAEIVRKIGKITRYETKAYVGDRRIIDLDKASGEEG